MVIIQTTHVREEPQRQYGTALWMGLSPGVTSVFLGEAVAESELKEGKALGQTKRTKGQKSPERGQTAACHGHTIVWVFFQGFQQWTLSQTCT